MPPCAPWINGDDVADCCSIEVSSGILFEQVASDASDLLFELSGRLYAGECGPKTVRPPCRGCWCGYQILSRGHIIGPWDYGYPYMSLCDECLVACAPSRIKLSGYPVRAISEVKIDGVVLAASEYTLHKSRYVTRLNNQRWPIRQNLTLADTEEGTFSITYTYGADPPEIAISAAAQLACELYKACTGENCALPIGATRITRQGVTFERQFWRRDPVTRAWRTGLTVVDAFLNAHAPSGLIRRPTFWSPSTRNRYAQDFG